MLDNSGTETIAHVELQMAVASVLNVCLHSSNLDTGYIACLPFKFHFYIFS